MSAELIFDRLASAALQGCVAVLLAWAVLRLARPLLSPSVRAAGWTIVFLCLLFGLVGSIPVPILPAGSAPSAAAATQETGLVRVALVQTAPLLSWKLVVVGLWLAAASILLAVTIRRHLRLRRVLAKMDEAPLAVQVEARSIAAQLGLRVMPDVRIDPRPQVPFIAGLRRPCLVLPSRLAEDQHSEEREAALSHELAHLRRGDLYVEALAAVCRCIFFFNPLVWAATREWAAEREMACDELVLRRGRVCAKRYCQMLIDFAACRAESSSLALAVTNGFRHLQRRINQMTKVKKTNRGAALVYSIAALSVVTLGAAPLVLKPSKSEEKPANPATIELANPELITQEKIADDLVFMDAEGNLLDTEAVLSTGLFIDPDDIVDIDAYGEDGEVIPLGTFTGVEIKEGKEGSTVTGVAVQPSKAPSAPAKISAQPSTAPKAASGKSVNGRVVAPSAPAAAQPSLNKAPAAAPSAEGRVLNKKAPSSAVEPVQAVSAVPAQPAKVTDQIKQVISIELNGAAFEEAIRAICKATGIEYSIHGTIVVNLSLGTGDRTVEEALNELSGQGFEWSADMATNKLIFRAK